MNLPNSILVSVVLKQHNLDLYTNATIIQQLIKEDHNYEIHINDINKEIGRLFELNSNSSEQLEIEEDLVNAIIFTENDNKR